MTRYTLLIEKTPMKITKNKYIYLIIEKKKNET